MTDAARGAYFEQEKPAFRNAIVKEIESVPPYRVRVTFPDHDNVTSYWLPVLVPKIQDDKFYWQPDIGEQVCVLMDANDEDGVVVGSIPSNVDQAPSGLTPSIFYIGFQDGTVIQYNRETHQLQISLGTGGTAVISNQAGAKLTLDSSGNIEAQAVTSISLQQGSSAVADALVLVSKLLTAFNAHTHGGVASGGGTTSTPTTPLTATDVESTLVKVSN